MIVTITKVEQEFTKGGAECRKVSGVTGDGKETTKLIFDNLKDKWGLLKENAIVEFKMVKRGQFWNVADIIPPEHQTEIGKTPKEQPPPQYKGGDTREQSIEAQVAVKEIGECWRAGKFKDNELEVIVYRAWLIDKLHHKGGKDEGKTQQTDKTHTPVNQSETAGEVPSNEARQVLPVEPITNAKELMDWALSHGKEFVPSWVRKEANIAPNAIITDEIAVEAYKTIKASTGWDKK